MKVNAWRNTIKIITEAFQGPRKVHSKIMFYTIDTLVLIMKGLPWLYREEL